MRLLRGLPTALFVVALPLAAITLSVRYAFNETHLWSYGFSRYEVDRTTGLDRSQIDQAADSLHDYFNDGRERFDFRVWQNGSLAPLYSEKEIQHLVDVKDLVRGLYRVQEASLAYVLAYVVLFFVWRRSGSLDTLARAVLGSGAVTLAAIVAFGIAASFGFDRLFTEFHVLSFSNDFWQLDPAHDRLIQMFPRDFWFDATFFVAILSLVQMLALTTASLLYLRSGREGSPPTAEEEAETGDSDAVAAPIHAR